MYGNNCMFRHEHRNYNQLHRHYYTPQLYVLETLYAASTDKTRFISEFEPITDTLSVFAKIHAENDGESEQSTVPSDSTIYEIDYPQIEQSFIKCCSSNQHVVVHNESSDQEGLKKESDYNTSSVNTTQESIAIQEEFPSKLGLNLCSSPV